MLSYPLIPPAAFLTSDIRLTANNIVAETVSPFTGSQQEFEYSGEWWEAEIAIPPLYTRANAEPVLAFLAALRGKSACFYLGDPAGTTARGTGGTSPAFFGGSQTGKIMALTGVGAGIIAKAGDYLQVGAGLNATRIQTSGGSTTFKYLYGGAGVSVNGEQYITSVRIKNLGAKTVTVSDNLGNTQTVATGVESSISLFGLGDGVAGYQLVFSAPLAADSLDFIVWAPRMQRWRLDENFIPTANQNFTGWTAGTGATITLTQGYNQRLYKALEDVTAFQGHATIPIFPRLRNDAQLDSDAVTFSNAKGVFRLTENPRSWQLGNDLLYKGITLKCKEAL